MNFPEKVFRAPDGTLFTGPDAEKECIDYIRMPEVKAALAVLCEGNEELINALIEHQDEILKAFETGTIRRVSKKERKMLSDALEKIESGFLKENAQAIIESFRWPTQKRLSEEEKKSSAIDNLATVFEDNDDLVEWIVEKRDELEEAFKAGRPKRQVPEKAMKALEEYRARKAAEKAAAAATE